MQEIIKIHESKLALIVKIAVLGGLTAAMSILTLLNSNLMAGIFFALLSFMLTYVIVFTWLQTGIFEEGENIRISNKSHGINTVFKRQQIQQIYLKQGKIEIELKDAAGLVQFPFGDFTQKEIQDLNARL